MSLPHVSVCVCTYRRPALLGRLLEKLAEQKNQAPCTFSVVVADNDAAKSAESVVASYAARLPIEVIYCAEPQQNIALARNRAIAHARGEFIAFIDDDEFPAPDWLGHLLRACETYQASGILGPVRPHFDEDPPKWIIKGRFCERPELPTGTRLEGGKCRTGNVLFRRSILEEGKDPFDARFGTGGEDVDFFTRMTQRGCTFFWCNEAVAYETVPPSRWTRSYMLGRALLRGRNTLKMNRGRAGLLAKSAIAVPAYSLVLPFAAIGGQHHFMKYCIRWCDHLGRLLAALGLNPMKNRVM